MAVLKLVAVLAMVGLLAVAVGPAWVVKDTHPAGKNVQVTCHEKFHPERIKKVIVPTTTQVKVGKGCPV